MAEKWAKSHLLIPPLKQRLRVYLQSPGQGEGQAPIGFLHPNENFALLGCTPMKILILPGHRGAPQ